MTILFRICSPSLNGLNEYLGEIADIQAALRKKYPDIVVNVEVELR